MATLYDPYLEANVGPTINGTTPNIQPVKIPTVSPYGTQTPVTTFQPNGSLIPGLTYGTPQTTGPTNTPTNTIKKVLPSARPGSVASIGTPLGYTDAGVPFYTQPATTSNITPTQPAPTGVVNQTGTQPTKTPAYTYTKTPDEIAADELRAKIEAYNTEQFNTSTDPNEIFNQKLREYQAQIDSLNNVYNEQIAQARREGQGRIESRQFAQGRSGQIGSGTGEAGINAVQDANRQVEQAIQAERANAIAAVYSKVRSDASAELATRTAAKKEGASALLEDLSKRPERKKARITSAVNAAIERGLDISTMSDEELKQVFGDLASKEEILSINKAAKEATAKTELDLLKSESELKKTEADIKKIEAEIKKGNIIELSEGGMLYDTVTGKTFKNPKTFAPKDSSVKDEQNYDAKTIPKNVKSDLIETVTNTKKLKLNELVVAFPEVNTDYLESIYNTYK